MNLKKIIAVAATSGTVGFASLGLGINLSWLIVAFIAAVAVLTLASVGAYVREWVRHMGSTEPS